MTKPFCVCRAFRRSDCLRGDQCKATLLNLIESERPQWVAARIVFTCMVTAVLVIMAAVTAKVLKRVAL